MELFCRYLARGKVCDCYIAFSNLNNHPLHRIMGEGAFWRIPDKPLITTVFFDVDGTLTDSQGKVSESYANALRYMAQSVSLYLATSLSMEQAKKKLGKALFLFIQGRSFLQMEGYYLIRARSGVCR